MSVEKANAKTLDGTPRRHERQPMGTRGCKVCVFSPEHPVHQSGEVVDLHMWRDRRRR